MDRSSSRVSDHESLRLRAQEANTLERELHRVGGGGGGGKGGTI